jgi:PKD repeat protein
MKSFNLIFLFFLLKLNILSQVTASFSSNISSGCSPLVVNFTNTSSNAISYYWEFNNGTTSNLNNPSATFINPGFYTIKLIAYNGLNSDSVIEVNYIHVLDKPNASFSFNIVENCETNNLINFLNSSSGAISYIWDFGNGDTNSIINPSYSYSYSGDYPITLVAYNSSGCSDDTTISPLSIYPTPILSANSDTSFICDSSHSFTFSGNSSNSTILSWDWDFGDGNSLLTNNSSINHIFNASGSFSPKVIAISTNGCIDSIDLNNINIFEKTNYSLLTNLNSGCPPLDVIFNLSPTNSILNVDWDFGDGNIISGSSISNNQYLNNGNFYPSAIVESNNGCIEEVFYNNSINVTNAPIGTYTMTNFSGCPPLPVQFNISTSLNNSINLNFGDGYSSTNNNITHTYLDNGRFYPTLTISDSNNCQSILNLDTILSGISNINFIASKTEGCASLEVDFTNLASDAINYYWEFGDGNISNEENPTHIYDSAGLYTVTLVANDSNSCFDTLTKTDYIFVKKEDVELVSIDTIIACSPFTFNTDVYNIGVNFWNWNFGDGVLDSGSNINHVYTSSGNYNVSLFTDAPNGCQYDINNFAYLIIDSLETDINLNINSDCNSGVVNILNNSSGAIQHQWNMGDGSVYTTANVQHNYNTSQSYVITYESISNIGCNSVQYYSVVFDCNNNNSNIIQMPPQNPINPLIDPSTGLNLNQTCGPQNVNLNSPFSSAIAWMWDFGDGQTSNDQNPTHYYANSGVFNVTHIGYNANGTAETLIINNFINQYNLNSNFNLSKNEYCNYNTYHFNHSFSNPSFWEWSLDSNFISNNSLDSITLQLNDSVSVLHLKISDQYGCVSESQQNIFLYHPLALIEQDSFACNSSNVLINCSVKDDPIHLWDMTDGTTISSDTAIIHQYQQSGWYNPILTLDNLGCIREITLDSIEIYEPDATFTPTFQNPICKTDSLFFTANNPNFIGYNWLGGNVTSNNSSFWAQFNEAGSQVVTLQVINRGCNAVFSSDTIIVNEAFANFNYTLLNNCIPINAVFQDSSSNALNWEWSFGNGNSSTIQNPTQQLLSFPTDSMKLIITDNNGCKDSIFKKFVNNFSAEFTASDSLVCSGNVINFSPISEVVNTWIWDFGDGNTSSDSVPSHTYLNPGLYNVQLITSDGQGCTDTIIKIDYIDVKQVISDFNYSVNGNCPPVVTSFNNQSTGGSNYFWDFGDNLTSIIQNPAHVYTNSGYYDVSLIANDNFGCSDTLTINNLVYIPGPILDFSIDQLFGCDSLNISILNNSINTSSYLYNFGDGSTSSLENPSKLYNSPGMYQITLVGEDSAGCQTSLISQDIITIDVTPIIDIQILDTNLCLNYSFDITNNSIYAASHSWIYGSSLFTTSSPSIVANLQDTNNLVYIAGNTNGTCYDTSYKEIITHYIPDVSIINPGILCSNQGILNLTTLNNSFYNNLTWTGNGVINPTTGLFNPLLVTDSSTLYLVHDSICSSSDTLIIFVDIPNDPTILTNDTIYCENTLVQTPSVINSGGYWLGQGIDSLTGVILNNLSPGIYNFNYILTNINNCIDTANYQIEILSNSDATILNPGVICDNLDTLSLSSINGGGIWSGQGINIQNGLIDVSSLSFGTYDYIYSVDGICSDKDTLNLEIFEFIEAIINPSDDFCEGLDSIGFTSNTNIGYWSGLPNTDSSNGWFTSNNLTDGTYEIYYSIYGNCPSKDSISFTILPEPDINVILSHPIPCVGFQLSVNNLSNNISNEDFAWYVNDSLYYPNFNEPYFLLDTGYYEIKVVASNQLNCSTEYIFPDLIPIYDTTSLPPSQVIRSTVIENQDIYTEWYSSSIYLNPISEHLIYKAVNEGDFDFLVAVDSSVNSYTDQDVDVSSNSYKYIIINKNICNVSSSNSNLGNSILLNFERVDNFRTKLNWNFYNGWTDNPNRYEIQKLNSNGIWETFISTENTENQIIINE